MNFEKQIKPLLTYIGAIGAILMSVAYIVLVFVLIVGFKARATMSTVTFSVVNAAVGLVICNLLKYQGISLAKELPKNQELVEKYYGTKTKDKRNHSLTYFWTTTLIKDFITKGLTLAASSFGIIYIVLVGSNDWSLLLMALVNLIMFICFGLLSLNKAYDYYNTTYVAYMEEQINERKQISEPGGDSTVPPSSSNRCEDRQMAIDFDGLNPVFDRR